MSGMTLDQHMEMLLDIAKKELDEGEETQSTVYLLGAEEPDGKRAMCVVPLFAEKSMWPTVVHHAKETIEKEKFGLVDAAIHVADAWMAHVSKEQWERERQDLTYKPPSQRPNKIEVIIALMMTKDGMVKHCMRTYKRTETGIVWDNIQWINDVTNARVFDGLFGFSVGPKH